MSPPADARETLRLPEPARTLWTRIRDPLKAALAYAALIGMRQDADEARRAATAAAEAGRGEIVLNAAAR